MKCLVLIVAVVALGSALHVSKFEASPCVEETQCTCQTDFGFIDLRPLANDSIMKANGPLALTSFEFNPCRTFTDKDCTDVLMCEITALTNKHQAVGTANNVKFIYYNDLPALYYETGQKKATVSLRCKEETTKPKFGFDRESLTQHYFFTLTTEHACENPNNTTSTTTQSTPTSSTHTTMNTTSTHTTANTTSTSHHTTDNSTATTHHSTANSTATTHHTTDNSTMTTDHTSSSPTSTMSTETTSSSTHKSTTMMSTPPTTQGANFLRPSPFAAVIVLAWILNTWIH